MQVLRLSCEAAVLHIKGELIREFISQKIIDQANRLLSTQTITVDLSQVSKVDTAGLAFLLLLLEDAKKSNIQLVFQHLPNDLLKLAKLSAVDSFLPVA